MTEFKANCLPLLIGSLPISDHKTATEIILQYTPEIPLWAQLPTYKEEGMIPQFLPGLPGVTEKDDKTFVDGTTESFESDLLAFYEDFIMATDGGTGLEGSRFAMTEATARGFFEFVKQLKEKDLKTAALKGQTTGPITFCTGVVDQDGRAIFYNDQLRDAAIKLLALKARWQVQEMAKLSKNVIMFFDEPALAGFGSSAFITITNEDIKACFGEVFDAVHSEKALAGVHVCANTEWSILFESDIDVVSFDAYSFFDKFILYPEQIKAFMERGGILASGIVPTTPEFIDIESTDSLVEKWLDQVTQLEKIGISRDIIFSQTLITPSCGTGSISMEHAKKVLKMTAEVSEKVRALK